MNSKFMFTAAEIDSRESRGVLAKLHDAIKKKIIIPQQNKKYIYVVRTAAQTVLIYFS